MLEDPSFGIRPAIYVLKECYDEPSPKVPISVIFGAKAFLPLKDEDGIKKKDKMKQEIKTSYL